MNEGVITSLFIVVLVVAILSGVTFLLIQNFSANASTPTPNTDTILLHIGTSTNLTQTPVSNLLGTAYLNNALYFDGNRSYVNDSTNPVLDVYQGAFSVTFWLNATNLTNNLLPRIVEKRNTFVGIMGDTTSPRFSQLVINLTNLTGSNSLELWSRANVSVNTWDFWAVTYNGSNGTWYKNGVEVGALALNISGVWTGDEQNTSGFDFLIGKRASDQQRNYNGSIDELRVFSRSLSGVEVSLINGFGRNHVNLADPNLVLYQSFNENQGTTSYDTSSNGAASNGTNVNTIYTPTLPLITLVRDTDYTLTGSNFTLGSSQTGIFDWDQIVFSYNYLLSNQGIQNLNQSSFTPINFIGIILLSLVFSIVLAIIITRLIPVLLPFINR